MADWRRVTLESPIADAEPTGYRVLEGKLAKPKISPHDRWSFDLTAVGGLTRPGGDEDRIRVFGQSESKGPVMAVEPAARFLTRLFDFNINLLKLDHSPEFNKQRVDVYLCELGQAGGQQRFEDDPFETDSFGRSTKVNTICIFQVGTLDDKVEACRELAHEYGHATLPPVKVMGGREDWANGHLGERVYLRYLHRQLSAGKLKPIDVFSADTAGLKSYLNRKYFPLVDRIASKGPDFQLLKSQSDAGFEAYLAVACYTFEVAPVEVFRRSLVLNPDQSPTGYAKSLMEALSERKVQNLHAPSDLQGKDWWIPVGKGKVTGAKVVESRGGWAKVHGATSVSIKNNPDK